MELLEKISLSLNKKEEDILNKTSEFRNNMEVMNIPDLFYETNRMFDDSSEWKTQFILGRSILEEHLEGRLDVELQRDVNSIYLEIDGIRISFVTYRSKGIVIEANSEIKRQVRHNYKIEKYRQELLRVLPIYLKNKNMKNFRKVSEVYSSSNLKDENILQRFYGYKYARNICNQEFLDGLISEKEKYETNKEKYEKDNDRYIKEIRCLMARIDDVEKLINLEEFTTNGYKLYYSPEIEKFRKDINST